MEYVRNLEKASSDQNIDSEHSDKYNFDVIAGNANFDLSSNTSENISESKYLCEKSSVYMQTLMQQSQDFMNAGADVIDALINDQGNSSLLMVRVCYGKSGTITGMSANQYLIGRIDLGSTTAAVAAAMLQNSPPQWFRSSSAMEALKSTEYFGPRLWDKNVFSGTFARPASNHTDLSFRMIFNLYHPIIYANLDLLVVITR